MILSGSIDHDGDHHDVARSAAAARRAAQEAQVDATRRSAEHAVDILLASLRDGSGDLDAAHEWEGKAMDAIDELSALLAALDLARSEPVIISPRTGS